MAVFVRWFLALLAPMLLSSCLLVPAKFTSSLDIRADRSFTFTYVGEVQLLKPSKSDPASDDVAGDERSDQSWNEESDGEARMIKIAAKPKKGGADKGESFGDTSDEAAQLRRLAQALSSEYGFRSARYVGNRKLAIDYRISGKLDHSFVFPFNPDGEALLPFIAIELRGKDRVRIKAPAFANEQSASALVGMSGMGGLPGLGGADNEGSPLDGVFTLTTNAEIVSQNQEDGAQTLPEGGKKIVWIVNPDTHDAPMAVLKVGALP